MLVLPRRCHGPLMRDTPTAWYHHSLIRPFRIFRVVDGTARQRREAWEYNQAYRHLLVQSAVVWMLVAAGMWKAGAILEHGGALWPAVICFLVLPVLTVGALLQLVAFAMMGRPFDSE